MEAIAYCAGCSGTTANGMDLRANPQLKVIAVDTGGAIKGNRIDVFIPNEAGAFEWGRKQVTVEILNE